MILEQTTGRQMHKQLLICVCVLREDGTYIAWKKKGEMYEVSGMMNSVTSAPTLRLVLIGSPFGELVCVAPLARKFHSYRQILGQVRRRKKNIHTFVHEAYFVVRRTVYLCASRS